MNGLLNINKPTGMTSRDVVNKVQRRIRPTKVGHAGTLDPLASGVLVVTVGQATRLTEYIQRMPKKYDGSFRLGVTSETEDITGVLVSIKNPPIPSLQAIEDVLTKFVGETMQRPPAYSALKVKGRRAYELARAGKQVKLEPRPITIYGMHVQDYAYPHLRLTIECGSGTYIRSLGRDIAESLGTGAVMSDLQRTAIGRFSIENAVALEQLDESEIENHLQPSSTAIVDVPTITLTNREVEQISFGQPIRRDDLNLTEIGALLPDGNLAAILERRSSGYIPTRNFVAQ